MKLRSGTVSIMGLVIVSIVLFDQLTKWAVLQSFQHGESIVVVPGVFNLVLHYNPGAAFGLFADVDPSYRQLVLGATTLIALGFILFFLIHDYYADRVGQIALALVVGGALGNVIDRVRFGKVVDFLDFYLRDYHWPAFNVADSCICVGVAVLIVWRPRKPAAAEAGERAPAA